MDRSLHPVVRHSSTMKSRTAPERVYRHQKRLMLHAILLLCDQALILLAFALAYWMRYHANWPALLQPVVAEVAIQNQVDLSAFFPTILLLMFVLMVLFETKGLYRRPRGTGLLNYAGIILSSTITGIAVLIVFVFLYRPSYYSRLIFAFAGINIVVLLMLWRVAISTALHWRWAHGAGMERVLVVGGNGLGHQVMNSIAAQPGLGYQIVGYLHNEEPPQRSTSRYPLLGSIETLPRMVATHRVQQVILALPFWEHGRLPQLVQECRTLGVDFRIAPDLYELSFDHVDIHHISGVPLLGLKELTLKGWNLALKRAIDIVLVVVSLPLLLPLLLLIGLLVRLDSAGPALFRQTRVGRNGQHFTCYKFRTMVVDAEQRRAELEALNEADGPLFKIRRDPRVTRFGSLLRRLSLDELPQLWNVLRGEMSLVGPRPALPDEVARYSPSHRRRLDVVPGLTGLWQVLGRSDTSFDEMVRLDIYYAENWSVGMDLRILLQTIPAVLLAKGAY